MWKSSNRLAVSFRVARQTSATLANYRTALVSLVVMPALEVLILVVISGALGVQDLVRVAYGSSLVALSSSVVVGIASQVARDRTSGILFETLSYKIFKYSYWLGKALVSMCSSIPVALFLMLAIWSIDLSKNVLLLGLAVALVPVVVLASTLVGIAITYFSLGLKDSYLLSNVFASCLPITSGVAVPISSYPPGLHLIAELFPASHSIVLLNLESSEALLSTVVFNGTLELIVGGVWFAGGLCFITASIGRLREGYLLEESS